MIDRNLTSTGMISTQAGVPHTRVLKVIDELRIPPAMTLNNVRYFDSKAVERIYDRVGKRTETCKR